MMGYACRIWRPDIRHQVMKLRKIKYKRYGIANNARWYAGNKRIHQDLGIPYFTEQSRVLTVSFESKLAGRGSVLLRQLRRYLCRAAADQRCPSHWRREPEVSSSVEAAHTKQPAHFGYAD